MTSLLTIKDIARVLGYSASTVSRALNNHPSISEEVKRKIQDYAHEHNFYINRMASQLRQSRVSPSRVIGVVVPELTHYYFSSVLTGVIDFATERGYSVMVALSNEQYEREVEICQRFDANRVCGIIVSQAKDTRDYAHFQRLIDKNIPLVFYDRICTGVDASRVVVDDYQGAFNAVAHLIQTGCRRIAFYGMDRELEIEKNRYNGYCDALLRAGIKPDPSLKLAADNREKAENVTPEVLNRAERPDAFFAINDDTAIGILHTAKRMGLQVPKDISICGFTNGQRAIACDPMLTTVEQRGREVGRHAAEILMDKAEGRIPMEKIERRVVRTRLVIRGTTRTQVLENYPPHHLFEK